MLRPLKPENIREKCPSKVAPRICPRAIREKAAGGQVVKVVREDDPDGKWNYEVVVNANGKESKFEVDPNGNFVKQHQ